MSKKNRERLTIVFLIWIISAIYWYIRDRTNFSFQETLGISPWLVFSITLLACFALAVYGHLKTKKGAGKS